MEIQAKELIEFLKKDLKIREEQHNQLLQLCLCSEQRIDKTNDMVKLLISAISSNTQAVEHCHQVLNDVTSEYCKRIDQLAVCRDQLQKENEILAKSNAQLIALLSSMGKSDVSIFNGSAQK